MYDLSGYFTSGQMHAHLEEFDDLKNKNHFIVILYVYMLGLRGFFIVVASFLE